MAKLIETKVKLIEAKIINLISEKLKTKCVNNNSDLIKDLGIDSLDLIILIIELESKFKIYIPEEKSKHFFKVSDITSFISDIIFR